jgi:hypothetical protein
MIPFFGKFCTCFFIEIYNKCKKKIGNTKKDYGMFLDD